MVAFAILLLIIILIILLSFKGNTSRKLGDLEREINLLKKQLQQSPAQVAAPAAITEEKPETPHAQTAGEPTWQTGFTVITDPAQSFKKEDWLPKEEPVKKEKEPIFVYTNTKEKSLQNEPLISPSVPVSKESIKPTVIPKQQKPTFFERNPDLEKFIGENLVSKIGIAILVLAIGYFVKYAIDNDWIGPVGRVGVGIICGGILISIAHKLRKNYHAFSSVLVGGGLAIFYFTITLAYQQFHLFGQTTAFVVLLLITAFAVLLALLYNRQELAVTALVGGFVSPFLVSNGSGNYIALFVYLIILNTGLLIIAYNKAWRILNTTAFVFTVILFGSWLLSLPYTETVAVYANGLLFATIFYLLFFVINIANNIKEKKRFIAFDFSILLSNTCLYFSAGLYCLNKMNAAEYNGLFSALMGVFNLGITYFLFRKNTLDKNILYLLIGITLTFVSLTAPLQLHGHFITLFWASEAVLLCWLYFKSKLEIIKYASLIVYIAMLVSLFGDWWNVYGNNYFEFGRPGSLTIIFNRAFITSIYAAAASYLLFTILQRNNTEKYAGIITSKVFRIVAIVILFLGGLLETGYQFSQHFSFINVALLYIQVYVFSFVLLLLFITKKFTKFTWNISTQAVLLSMCIVLYFIQLPQTFQIQQTLLATQIAGYNYLFIGHWASAVLAGIILYRLTSLIIINKQKDAVTWILCGAAVWYLSAELFLLINSMFHARASGADIERIFTKAVLPVLWGLCSFGFMWLGMKHKYKTLRIVSLSLFSLTLIKLFAYDISNIPVAGKIAAFFCLGVLLLIISFMYQRLKKIIIADEKKPVV